MNNCKFCGSKQIFIKKKLRSPVNAQYYPLYRCKNCKSAFFNPTEYPVDLQTMYNDFVDRADFPVDFKPKKKWIKEKDIILKLLVKSPDSILDVGCRTGDFLMHFDQTTEKVGVELSSNFVEVCKKRGLNVYNDFLENINFNSSFDIVTCYAILEHLENPLKFLDSLTSIVKKDGILVIMIPYYLSLKEKLITFFGHQWHMYSPPEHLNFYSTKFLDAYLSEKGFKKVKQKYQSGGMLIFNNKLLSKIESSLLTILDNSIFAKFPLFDHLYAYYIKK